MKIIYEFREIDELLRSPQMHEVISTYYFANNPMCRMSVVADYQRYGEAKFWLMSDMMEPIKEIRLIDYLAIIYEVLKYKIPYQLGYDD